MLDNCPQLEARCESELVLATDAKRKWNEHMRNEEMS